MNQILGNNLNRNRSIVLSSDGKWLYVASYDNNIYKYNTTTCEIKYIISNIGRTEIIYTLVLSLDDKWLYSLSQYGPDRYTVIKKYNTINGQVTNKMKGLARWKCPIQLSTDGEVLYTVCCNSMDCWPSPHMIHGVNTTSRLIDRRLECVKNIRYYEDISSLALSCDSEWLYAGLKRSISNYNYKCLIIQWNISTCQVKQIFEGHTDMVTSITLSNDNKWCYSGSADRTIRKWDIVSGKSVFVLKGHKNIVSSLVLSSNNELLYSVSRDNTIRKWNTVSGQLIRVIEIRKESVCNLALSPDDEWLYCGLQKIHTSYEEECKTEIYKWLDTNDTYKMCHIEPILNIICEYADTIISKKETIKLRKKK